MVEHALNMCAKVIATEHKLFRKVKENAKKREKNINMANKLDFVFKNVFQRDCKGLNLTKVFQM